MRADASARRGEAGFTLVELVVSLAIFALLAAAGLALVDGILGIQARTAGRLDRLADVRRALFLLSSDLAQVQAGPMEGGGAALAFARPFASAGGLPGTVRYALGGEGWTRTVDGQVQSMLPGTTALRFRFWTARDGWLDRWPPDATRREEWPAAVEADATLAGRPGGHLRRLVALPARP